MASFFFLKISSTLKGWRAAAPTHPAFLFFLVSSGGGGGGISEGGGGAPCDPRDDTVWPLDINGGGGGGRSSGGGGGANDSGGGGGGILSVALSDTSLCDEYPFMLSWYA